MIELFRRLPEATTEERQVALVAAEKHCKTLEQVEIPVQEWFSDGCYGREVYIKAGTALVGEIHKTPWIIVVSRGLLTVFTEDGEKLIDARERPVTFISPAGAKRAGVVHEDTYWTGFCATSLTDTASIREQLLAESYEDLVKLEDK